MDYKVNTKCWPNFVPSHCVCNVTFQRLSNKHTLQRGLCMCKFVEWKKIIEMLYVFWHRWLQERKNSEKSVYFFSVACGGVMNFGVSTMQKWCECLERCKHRDIVGKCAKHNAVAVLCTATDCNSTMTIPHNGFMAWVGLYPFLFASL